MTNKSKYDKIYLSKEKRGSEAIEKWNNGLCTKCYRGDYCLRALYEEIYFYKCNNCGHVVKFATIMTKKIFKK